MLKIEDFKNKSKQDFPIIIKSPHLHWKTQARIYYIIWDYDDIDNFKPELLCFWKNAETCIIPIECNVTDSIEGEHHIHNFGHELVEPNAKQILEIKMTKQKDSKQIQDIYSLKELEASMKEGTKQSEGKLNYELDFGFIKQLAERMAQNKGKYEPYNWKKPIVVEGLKQALFRHVMDYMTNDNTLDDGREYGHLESIALNVMMINYQLKYNKQNDKI